VFQDYFSKWLLVYPVPDQKAITLVELLTKEILPVPEALLSDQGTNLLSHLMSDDCARFGIVKLSITAYHPECDGMVEHFNRTLKAMLHKHVSHSGTSTPVTVKYALGIQVHAASVRYLIILILSIPFCSVVFQSVRFLCVAILSVTLCSVQSPSGRSIPYIKKKKRFKDLRIKQFLLLVTMLPPVLNIH